MRKQPQRIRFQIPDGPVLYGDRWAGTGGAMIVLLHGGGQTRRSWVREAASLHEAGYSVLTYDARGHGESDWVADGDYSVSALADDLLHILSALPRPIALVGASMGGMTSFQALGASDRNIADALVLVDIVPRIAKKGGQRITRFMTAHLNGFATLEEAVEAVAAYNPNRATPLDSSNLMHNLRLREDGRLYWHWDPRILDGRSTADVPSMNDGMLDLASNITIPTMLVRGGASDIVDDTGVEELRRLLPQMVIHTVASASHMVAGDDNSTFHAGIFPFLQKHLPSARTEK